jgi:hypothetical protein
LFVFTDVICDITVLVGQFEDEYLFKTTYDKLYQNLGGKNSKEIEAANKVKFTIPMIFPSAKETFFSE